MTIDELPGGWELMRAHADPERHARGWLREHLGRNADTAFCREHGLDASTDLDAFRERVPVRTYADLAPWIERSVDGEASVLTVDPVVHVAETAGTTSTPKRIPVTRRGLACLKQAQRLFLAALERDVPAVAAPHTWLLRKGWRRHGLLDLGELPGGP